MQYILTSSRIWLALGITCFALAATSLILTDILQLHPCYLCVFQRFLYLIIAGFAVTTAVLRWRILNIVFGILILVCIIAGISVAGYQVWLQSRPGAEFMCSGGDPNIIELFVIWLNQWTTWLFQATGNCADKELVILGLSLAGWSLIGFIVSSVAAILALWRTPVR